MTTTTTTTTTTTCKELKRWTIDADWAIVKTRDESDGEVYFEVRHQGAFDDAYDTLEGARENIREQKNQVLVTEIYDLLADIEVDLGAKGAAAKLKAIARFLKK